MTAPAITAPFVTLHAIQAFPPSLLNRDDSNATKQIVFGDTTRVRVSAQSLRRAIRTAMRQHRISGADYALRSNRFPALAAGVLAERHGRSLPAAIAKAGAVFQALKFKVTDKGNTAVMIFANEVFPVVLADLVNTHWDAITDSPAGAAETKPPVPDELVSAASTALDVGRTLDLALFGRMLAEKPNGGRVDGAAGVAHAWSVDAAAIEPDWWAAVDDAAGDDEPASSNLGVSMVSAPVLYRHASLDRRALRRNLAVSTPTAEALAIDGAASFIEWFVRATPSAKQRSSVAATLPSLVVASIGDQVLSAANAFATPVTGPDVMATAATRLLATLDRGADALGGSITHRVLCTDPALDEHLRDRGDTTTSIAEFINAIQAA